MKTAWELAEDLNSFAESYDLYEYRDCVDDPTQNIIELAQMIQNGRTEGIFDWLLQVAEEAEEGTKESETVKILLQEMKERRMNEHASTYGRTFETAVYGGDWNGT